MDVATDLTRAAAGATRKLAAFASSLTFEALPSDVVEKVKLCSLDTLGCCIFGNSLASVRKLAAVILGEGAAAQATVFGRSVRTSPSSAALLNATAAHAFQLDEIHIESTLHPGSLALPASFALGETRKDTSGRDLIVAMVAGYEVGLRIGLALRGGMFKSGFHNQGTTGVFVAAAAAARMLGLDTGQTEQAFGIAASQAAGLMAVQDGAMTKSFHSGRAAQSGVYAALLARQGYTGINDVLDGAYGTFFASFVNDWAPEPLAQGLGCDWKVMRVGFKSAPASNGSITAMTAVDRIMREQGLQAADIESITGFVSDNTLHHCGWPYIPERVASVLSAQMNLFYGVAVMAIDRRASIDQFDERRILDPEILHFIERIKVQHDPAFDADMGRYRVGCRMIVRARERDFETTVLYRKGSPDDPMTRSELEQKFRLLAGDVKNVDALVDATMSLDELRSIEVLGRLCADLAV